MHPCITGTGSKQAHLPLGDLKGALILANLQQLDNALLVGRHASDLTDDVTNELDALALEL